jgi:AsmA protein
MIPVVVQGPWDNLSYRPQLDGLLKQPGKALQGLENAIQGQGGTPGTAAPGATPSTKPNPGALLKGLFGGSKP